MPKKNEPSTEKYTFFRENGYEHRWRTNSRVASGLKRQDAPWVFDIQMSCGDFNIRYKQRVLMHGHQGWNVRHGLCHIYMIYVYIWVVYSFCLFCCLFIIVTTQFVALYKPCKPKPKPSTYDPPDNHPLAEIQRPILRPEPKQQICHQHANTDHFGK